jgi:hypothetical protein
MIIYEGFNFGVNRHVSCYLVELLMQKNIDVAGVFRYVEYIHGNVGDCDSVYKLTNKLQPVDMFPFSC